MTESGQRYYTLNEYLRHLYGERVQKITVDAGFTCPNRDGTLYGDGCIYCNDRGSGTGDRARGISIVEQIRTNARRVAERYNARKFLIYFQSYSNTYAPVERLKQVYDAALRAIDGVVGLSIGTRPDCVDGQKLRLLQDYAENHLIWVEYGLQSSNDRTLRRIHRGHDAASFENAVKATQSRGISICAHVILGLPGESRKEMMETARFIAGLGLDGVKIHLLYVIRGTALETLYRRGIYKCLDMPEYADLVREFLEYLPPGMVIQRLTGDPHPEELVAPEWALEKQAVRRKIHETIALKNGWQGKQYAGPAEFH